MLSKKDVILILKKLVKFLEGCLERDRQAGKPQGWGTGYLRGKTDGYKSAISYLEEK